MTALCRLDTLFFALLALPLLEVGSVGGVGVVFSAARAGSLSDSGSLDEVRCEGTIIGVGRGGGGHWKDRQYTSWTS